MKLTKIIIGMLIMLSFALAAAVGYIDVRQVFEGYHKTRDAQQEINDKMKDYERLRNRHLQALSEARIDGKSAQEIEKMEADIRRELEPKESELEVLNEELMARIRREIVSAVEVVSREVGIDVVVDKQVIIAGGLDLTDSVITRLNRR